MKMGEHHLAVHGQAQQSRAAQQRKWLTHRRTKPMPRLHLELEQMTKLVHVSLKFLDLSGTLTISNLISVE